MSGSKSDLIFAADLGGTHLRAAVVGCDGKIHYRLKQPTRQGEKPDGIVHALVDAAHEGERQTAARGGQISAVSIAVPGTVNFEDGVVVKAPNVPCLDGFSTIKWLGALRTAHAPASDRAGVSASSAKRKNNSG